MINLIRKVLKLPPLCHHIYKDVEETYLTSEMKTTNYNSHIECDRIEKYCIKRECIKCGQVDYRVENRDVF